MTNSHDVTGLLLKWSDGDSEALNDLMPLVYDEMQRIAHGYLRNERSGHTLQTTALVNEAYLKLVDQTRIQWQNRAHFLGIAANAMRRILIDHARKRLSGKRGSGAQKISIDERAIDIRDEKASELIELDAALKKLAEIAPERSRLVELKYFGGLSNDEIAECLGISTPTVNRHWRLTKAWLYNEISGVS